MAERLDGDQTADFLFEGPRQVQVCRRLGELVGPGPAALYYDACKLRSNAGNHFTSRTHLIAHLLREVESALRHVIAPAELPRSPACPTCGLEAPEGHKNVIKAALGVLDAGGNDPLASAWTTGLNEIAHRQNFSAPRQFDEAAQNLFGRYDAVFDLVLQRFEERFLIAVERIDALRVIPSPSKRDAKTLQTKCPNHATIFERFFSDHLSAKWIGALNTAGFLDDPPENAVGPLIRYARGIASSDHKACEQILHKLPTIANADVCTAYLGALQTLPVARLPALLPKVFSWLDNREQLTSTERALTMNLFERLAIRLLEGDHTSEATTLLEKLGSVG